MWKWIVMRYRKTSGSFTTISCQELVYTADISDTGDDLAFTACESWIENNASDGSEYYITKAYFYKSKL